MADSLFSVHMCLRIGNYVCMYVIMYIFCAYVHARRSDPHKEAHGLDSQYVFRIKDCRDHVTDAWRLIRVNMFVAKK
jgi:hypothetical protein